MSAIWIVLVFLFGCARSARSETATADAPPEVDRVLLTGTLEATAAIEVRAPDVDESQLAVRWLVADRTTVKAGDRIAELDGTALVERLRIERRDLDTAETAARAAARSTAADLAAKRGAVRGAEIALEKAKLRAEIPADLVDARRAQDDKLELVRAEATLVATREELATLIQLQAIDAQMNTIALVRQRRAMKADETWLSDLVLRAPHDGLVAIADNDSTHKAFVVGDLVEKRRPVVLQPDLAKPMQVRTQLADVDDGRASIGQKATCTLDAFPEVPLDCEITRLAPVATVAMRDSTRRSFAVVLSITAPTLRLRPGMSVKVDLRGDS